MLGAGKWALDVSGTGLGAKERLVDPVNSLLSWTSTIKGYV